jgi:hypothetical protein
MRPATAARFVRAGVDGERAGAGLRPVSWNAPATLARRNHPLDPFRPLIPPFATLLTCGGRPWRADDRALGTRACAPIYNAVGPDTH